AILITYHHTASWIISQRTSVVSGTGGFQRWSHPGMPVAPPPYPCTLPGSLRHHHPMGPEPETTPEIPAEYMAFQNVQQAGSHPATLSLAMGLCHRAAAWSSTTERKDLPLVHPGAPGDGGVHQGGTTTGFYPAIHLAGRFKLLLRGQEEWRSLSLYRLTPAHFTNHPTAVSPFPLVPATLEELRGARIFSKLDLRSAYNLIRIRAGDEWKRAFSTPTRHYEYCVMTYGLSISPSVFQTFMNEEFREFLYRFAVVYIDDILIYSRNLPDHRQHIQALPLLEVGKFLGYVVSAEGVQMDQRKVQAIQDWPPPITIKELQRFLGFSNFYRRFIKDYSMITTPLTSLLRGKPKHLLWKPAAHEAFHRLKTIFCTIPITCFHLRTIGEPPLLHPCAYFSRKLSVAEQNYDVGNHELLAIKLALEEPQELHEAKRLNPRQARWALFLTRFNYKITFRPGTKNTKADALSRQFSADSPAEPKTIIPSDVIISPIVWDLENDICHVILQEPAPSTCPAPNVNTFWAP
ncbi:hypothetical protein M9458_015626, partial [Cirrhinus mrigala]